MLNAETIESNYRPFCMIIRYNGNVNRRVSNQLNLIEHFHFYQLIQNYTHKKIIKQIVSTKKYFITFQSNCIVTYLQHNRICLFRKIKTSIA